jgi:hypothetical protein
MRIFESFVCSKLKYKSSTSQLMHGEYTFYWSKSITLIYEFEEELIEEPNYSSNNNKMLNVTFYLLTTTDIIKKFNIDRFNFRKILEEMKKKNQQTSFVNKHNTYERMKQFLKDIYDTDRTPELLNKLSLAFQRERYLQRYFHDKDTTFSSFKEVSIANINF